MELFVIEVCELKVQMNCCWGLGCVLEEVGTDGKISEHISILQGWEIRDQKARNVSSGWQESVVQECFLSQLTD